MRSVQIVLGLAFLCLVVGVANAQPMTGSVGPMGGMRSPSEGLADLIGSTVQPSSWDNVGGPGSVAPFDSNLSLVVGQTQEVHEEVVDLLEQLRRMQDLQVTVETPFRTVSDSFYEKIGVGGWSGSIKGVPFSVNQGAVNPSFGHYDPSAGLKTGVSFQHGDSHVNFPNLEANQGYRQTAVTQSPSATMFNGQRAYVSDTSQSPFVVSVIPVVGGRPILPMPPAAFCYVPSRRPVLSVSNPRNHKVEMYRRKLAAKEQQEDKTKKRAGEDEYFRRVEDPNVPQRIPIKPEKAAELQAVERKAGGDLNPAAPARTAAPAPRGRNLVSAQASSAGRAVPSVAEARRMHQAEQSKGNDKARVDYERGLAAEEKGKPAVAKIYYGMALKQATGQFRDEILARLRAIAPRE